MKTLLNILFPDAQLVNDAAAWLVQQVKSQVRKNLAYENQVSTLRHCINSEFGNEIDNVKFLKILSLTKQELIRSGIDMLVDDKHMVANRPISAEALI
jgi:hypothetical protein